FRVRSSNESQTATVPALGPGTDEYSFTTGQAGGTEVWISDPANDSKITTQKVLIRGGSKNIKSGDTFRLYVSKAPKGSALLSTLDPKVSPDGSWAAEVTLGEPTIQGSQTFTIWGDFQGTESKVLTLVRVSDDTRKLAYTIHTNVPNYEVELSKNDGPFEKLGTAQGRDFPVELQPGLYRVRVTKNGKSETRSWEAGATGTPTQWNLPLPEEPVPPTIAKVEIMSPASGSLVDRNIRVAGKAAGVSEVEVFVVTNQPYSQGKAQVRPDGTWEGNAVVGAADDYGVTAKIYAIAGTARSQDVEVKRGSRPPPPPDSVWIGPAGINFLEGSDPQPVHIKAPGYSWKAEPNQPWISLSPTGGTGDGQFQVSVSRQGLPNGEHKGAITLRFAQSGSEVTKTVNIAMLVGPPPPPSLTLSPSVINLGTQQNEAAIEVTGVRGTDWKVTSSLPPWLTFMTNNFGFEDGVVRFKVERTDVPQDTQPNSSLQTSLVFKFERDGKPLGEKAVDVSMIVVEPPASLKVENVRVAKVSSKEAVITWTTTAPAGDQVEYGQTTGMGQNTPPIVHPSREHQVVLLNLSPKTRYYFRVRSSNKFKTAMMPPAGPGTEEYSFTTLGSGGDTLGLRVENVHVVLVSLSEAVIAWNTNTKAGHQVEFGAEPKMGQYTTPIPTPSLDHEVRVTGLEPNTKYYFRVRSSNESQTAMVPALGPGTDEYSFTTGQTGGSEVWISDPADDSKITTQKVLIRGGSKNINGGDTIRLYVSKAPKGSALLSTLDPKVSPDGSWATEVTLGEPTIQGSQTFAIWGDFQGTESKVLTLVRVSGDTRKLAYTVHTNVSNYEVELSKNNGPFEKLGTAQGQDFPVELQPGLYRVRVTKNGKSETRSWEAGEAGTPTLWNLPLPEEPLPTAKVEITSPASGSLVDRNIRVTGKAAGVSEVEVFVVTNQPYLQGKAQVRPDGTWEGNAVIGAAEDYGITAKIYAIAGTARSQDVEVKRGSGPRPPSLRAENVRVVSVSLNEAVIAWKTNTPAGHQVEFGAEPKMGQYTTPIPTPSLEHEVRVTGLQPNTKYYFRVRSSNESQTAMVPALGPGTDEYSFTTGQFQQAQISIDVPSDRDAVDHKFKIIGHATGVSEVEVLILTDKLHSQGKATVKDGVWELEATLGRDSDQRALGKLYAVQGAVRSQEIIVRRRGSKEYEATAQRCVPLIQEGNNLLVTASSAIQSPELARSWKRDFRAFKTRLEQFFSSLLGLPGIPSQGWPWQQKYPPELTELKDDLYWSRLVPKETEVTKALVEYDYQRISNPYLRNLVQTIVTKGTTVKGRQEITTTLVVAGMTGGVGGTIGGVSGAMSVLGKELVLDGLDLALESLKGVIDDFDFLDLSQEKQESIKLIYKSGIDIIRLAGAVGSVADAKLPGEKIAKILKILQSDYGFITESTEDIGTTRKVTGRLGSGERITLDFLVASGQTIEVSLTPQSNFFAAKVELIPYSPEPDEVVLWYDLNVDDFADAYKDLKLERSGQGVYQGQLANNVIIQWWKKLTKKTQTIRYYAEAKSLSRASVLSVKKQVALGATIPLATVSILPVSNADAVSRSFQVTGTASDAHEVSVYVRTNAEYLQETVPVIDGTWKATVNIGALNDYGITATVYARSGDVTSNQISVTRERGLASITVATNPIVPGAKVFLNDREMPSTGPDGQLTIQSLTPGAYNVRVTKDGYEDVSGEISIPPSKTLVLNPVKKEPPPTSLTISNARAEVIGENTATGDAARFLVHQRSSSGAERSRRRGYVLLQGSLQYRVHKGAGPEVRRSGELQSVLHYRKPT
ncbi:MAG: fibronectin type III domain-containing protein, partial [Armatimonadetes bacterium]|nr:fibronectin type III domain-containing protein [Armatimonadota bacterium]